MNHSLNEALGHAASAKDIESLKSLARSESRRADMAEQLLIAVLKVTGPARVPAAFQTADRNTGSFVLTELEDGSFSVRAGP